MATFASTPRGPASQHPLVIPPASKPHKQTIIALHGRGSTAKTFADALLQLPAAEHGTLQTAFPHAKFIFPEAPLRPVARSEGTIISHQWFDFWSLINPSERLEIQFEGLMKSTEVVHALLREEIESLGARNVVVWGLSQGCAAGLVAMLLWEGEAIAAWVGMCGWLPLRGELEDAMSSNGGEEQFDRLVACLRDKIGLPSSTEHRNGSETRVFLGNGEEDNIVPLHLAKEAASLLKAVGAEVEYRTYSAPRHWFSQKMLSDIVGFIKAQPDWIEGAAKEPRRWSRIADGIRCKIGSLKH